jgi:galactokinase
MCGEHGHARRQVPENIAEVVGLDLHPGSSYDPRLVTRSTGTLVAFAPGRVNLIGEHTDYSGGLVLPVAIQYGVSVDVHAEAEEISLSSEQAGPAPPFAADGGGSPATGWARYGQAVAGELDLLGRPPVGLAGTVRSDLPTGAGLSSSAALEVSIALALCAVAEFELEPLELALACQRAELRAVGVPCGILDQAASVLGRDGEAILLDCSTLEYRPVRVPAQVALVVVDSAVSHSHESSGYADRRRELEHAMGLVGATRSTEVDPAVLESLDSLSQRRLRHVVTENRRVVDFADALERGDLVAAGGLLLASHASLRDDYEVSIPEIDLLVELACDAGAYGARLLGGGFGGSILALADAARADEIAQAVSESYSARTGRAGASLVARASAGAGLRR